MHHRGSDRGNRPKPQPKAKQQEQDVPAPPSRSRAVVLLVVLLLPPLIFCLLLLSTWRSNNTQALASSSYFPANNRNFTCTLSPAKLQQKLLLINGNTDGPFGTTQCQLLRTPSPLYQQKCCTFLRPGSTTCLPNLVVLGSQKAGTTALFSYLLHHPEVRAGPKKEMHLYDFDKNYKILLDLLPQLLPHSPSAALAERQVTADATPSYIADPKACYRMAKFLPSSARMVLLLRDPVKRTWSDFQMKLRRMAFQRDFLFRVVPKYKRELKVCMVECINASAAAARGDKTVRCSHVYEFRTCLPEEIGRHGRLGTFFAWFKRSKMDELVEFMNTCLNEVEGEEEDGCFAPGGRFHDRILRETMPVLPQTVFEEGVRLNSTLRTCRTYEECFPRTEMMSDVGFNHLFRSLYFVHIQHCLSFIDRERILIVNSDELQHSPRDVLRRIFVHTGIAADEEVLDRLSALSAKELHDTFKARYPDFENVSGWSKSAPAVMEAGEKADEPKLEMTPELHQYMSDFFRPWNKRLFDEVLHGEPAWKGWAV